MLFDGKGIFLVGQRHLFYFCDNALIARLTIDNCISMGESLLFKGTALAHLFLF